MNRKWRTNREAVDTVQAYPAFRDSIPPRDADYQLSDPSDIYAVYTVLHIESKHAELRWSPEGGFYYFLAHWEQPIAQEKAAEAPEGDEDPPPQIVPEGSQAALQHAAAASEQQQQQHPNKKQRQQPQQQRQQPQQQQPQQQQAAQQQQGEGPAQLGAATHAAQPQAGAPPAAGGEPGPPPAAADPPGTPSTAVPSAGGASLAAPGGSASDAAAQVAGAAPAPATRLRTQIIVPVSSAHRGLTPELLHRMFLVRGVQAQQLLLALVDSNGVVTRSCLYNYIQAPLEGPGTANLDLLDD